MDILQQAHVFTFLKENGYILQESTLSRLRFEKGGKSEIILLYSAKILPVQINSEPTSYTANDFEELINCLKEIVELKAERGVQDSILSNV